MFVYSNTSRYEHNLTESLANPDKRDVALGQIFDALDEAIHKGSYAKVIANNVHSSGALKSYFFIDGGDGWELQLQIEGQIMHNTTIYSSANDDNHNLILITHDSSFIIRKTQESK